MKPIEKVRISEGGVEVLIDGAWWEVFYRPSLAAQGLVVTHPDLEAEGAAVFADPDDEESAMDWVDNVHFDRALADLLKDWVHSDRKENRTIDWPPQ